MSQSSSTLSLPESCLRGDEAGHFRILVLGNSSRDTRRSAKHLASALHLGLHSLEDNRHQNVIFDIQTSWVIHGRRVVGEAATRALNSATDIIWLDAPFLSGTGKIGQRLISRVLREPIRLSGPSPARVLAQNWQQYLSNRASIKAAHSSDENQDRWVNFCGWEGQGELRLWLKQFDVAQRSLQSIATDCKQLDEDYHYPVGLALMLF